MTVSAILARKGSFVATIRPDASVAQLVADLCRHGVGALVVSEDASAILGIVSERDVIRGLGRHGDGLMAKTVEDIMTREVRHAAPETRVEAVMALMTAGRFRHVPILDGGALAGIVSIGDVVSHRIREIEAEASEMRSYIAGQ